MKLLKSFLCLLTIVSLCACSSDDDGGSSSVELTVDNLVGTYNFVYYAGMGETRETDSEGNVTVTSTDTYSATDFNNATATFSANGMYELSGSYTESYTITENGGTPETDIEVITFTETGTFSVNTENRTLILGDEIYAVTRFDGSELRIVNSYEETFNNVTEVDEYEWRLIKQN